jgi:Heavy-metal resistance protein CzcE
MENRMKPLFCNIAVLALSAASLSAFASMKPADLYGEAAQAPSTERAIYTAVADRTITVTGDTKWVNVNHYEVVRFVSNGREFTWYFDGVAQPRPFNLTEIAPAGFLNHSVTVYVAPSESDFPG